MVSFILSTLALALSAAAAPTSTATAGSITYFNPALGACGWYNGDGDYIVAVGVPVFDSIHPCGRRIRVYANGRSVDVTVVDRCVGCGASGLDLSPAAFQAVFGDLGIGRANADWEWI